MQIKQLKNILLLSLFFYSIVSSAQGKDFVGSYTYSEMEFAEQIHILASHRFSWQQVYGATDIDLRGKWVVKGDTLVGTLDPVPDNKKPGQLEAVLTPSGDLSLIKFVGNSVSDSKPKILQRSSQSLSKEKAKELAKSITYLKVVTSSNRQLERQKESEQKRFEKFNNERKQLGKYHGFFKSDNANSAVVLGLNARRNQFFLTKPDPEEGDVHFFQGTFKVKNDTAYATTSAEQDEIKLYGSHSDDVKEEDVVIYFRKLTSKTIQVKSGKSFDEANFISSKKFKTENDSVQYVQLNKGDSLWIGVGKKAAHMYSFSLQDLNYNQLLVQPNYAALETWVDKPIYITDEDEIYSLYEDQVILKLTTPERLYSPVSMTPLYPKFKEKRYIPIMRKHLFKFQNQ